MAKTRKPLAQTAPVEVQTSTELLLASAHPDTQIMGIPSTVDLRYTAQDLAKIMTRRFKLNYTRQFEEALAFERKATEERSEAGDKLEKCRASLTDSKWLVQLEDAAAALKKAGFSQVDVTLTPGVVHTDATPVTFLMEGSITVKSPNNNAYSSVDSIEVVRKLPAPAELNQALDIYNQAANLEAQAQEKTREARRRIANLSEMAADAEAAAAEMTIRREVNGQDLIDKILAEADRIADAQVNK